jgi:hypothetical protein
MPTKSSEKPNVDQLERFKQAARAAECDEDEAHFEAQLKAVAKAVPPPKGSAKNAKKKPGRYDLPCFFGPVLA